MMVALKVQKAGEKTNEASPVPAPQDLQSCGSEYKDLQS